MHASIESRKNAFCPWLWVREREKGIGNRWCGVGDSDKQELKSSLYSCIKPLTNWEPSKTTDDTHHKGIFNFDFSPNGSILAAACEGKSILLFDPLTGRLTQRKNEAHADCVNVVKFLDTRILATCSDDTTIALWDIRKMKNKLQCLEGHSSWVKNIEYCPKRDLLISSGFDGCIYTWDINSFSEEDTKGQKVLGYKPLMRTKLSPDGTKLFMSTDHGCVFIVHDLYLPTLVEDLKSFPPFRFRDIVDQACSDDSRAEPRTRNRAEVIYDWPQGNKASVIASLQVHPQGWCVLTRNTSGDHNSEWTCIHDAQEYKQSANDDQSHSTIPQPSTSCSQSGHTTTNTTAHSRGRQENDRQTTQSRTPPRSHPGHHDHQVTPEGAQGSHNNTFTSTGAASLGESLFDFVSDDSDEEVVDFTGDEDDHDVRINSLDSLLANGEPNPRSVINPIDAQRAISDILTIVFGRGSRHVFRLNHLDQIHQNSDFPNSTYSKYSRKRLLYYTEEPNVGRGFIKELCFNSDGRLVCSPFGFGIRLLSFDSSCHELCDVVPKDPVKMYELGSCMSHSNNVVTCKFSPVHCLLVSGCLSGRVTFHQPVL